MTTTTTNGETHDQTTDQVPHERYHAVNRKAHSSQQDAADAWAEGAYPTHSTHFGVYELPSAVREGVTDDAAAKVAKLYSSENFEGYQHPDGTGVLMHYSTREAIRTRNGLIVSNSQCWATGFAHCSTPEKTDCSAPLSAVEELLDDEHDVYDITAVRTETVGYSTTKLVEIDGGAYGVYVGRDNSIINGDRGFVFRLTGAEVAEYRDHPEDVTELLTPREVRESDREVVDSREFTKSSSYYRTDDGELPEWMQAHVDAGGRLSESNSQWSDRKVNRQHFRADLRGDVIVRQGEWFFKPAEPVGDPTDLTFVSGVPAECEACGATRFSVDQTTTTCEECGLRHVDQTADAENPLGNHIPRDLLVIDGEAFVRGEVRHAENDHNAINLGETWHKALTHDRDVLMYDRHPTRPERSSRRRWD